MNPVLAEVRRNGIVESTHRGSAIVVDTRGQTVLAVGDVERSIYPRSSLKFFQAIPLLQSGAADQFGLDEREISLACASHNAEAIHVDTVRNWLSRLELTDDDLECGVALPLHEKSAHQLIADHGEQTRAHMNCSGKHTGMLTLAQHLGAGTKGYSQYDHPAQQAWLESLSELTGEDAHTYPWERDGCGMPAVVMPMRSLAIAFSRYAELDDDRTTLPTDMRKAMSRILHALRQYPQMVAGSDRCCTAVIEKTAGRVVVKTGAEAVYGGVIPHLGLGFALKVDDGNTRGSEVALGGLLKRIGVISSAVEAALQAYFQPQITNTQGWKTGEILSSDVWSKTAYEMTN